MRLGGHLFNVSSLSELSELESKFDTYGLSAIVAPLESMTIPECKEFGIKAREMGLVVGEHGFWENLLTDDKELQTLRIDKLRALLVKADVMGCHSVVSLIGSKDPSDSPLATHRYMHTEDCKVEFSKIVERVLDGLDLKTTKYIIEPWHNTFFYQPQDIKNFIDYVGHPNFGLHLDQMNMISQETYHNNTNLINLTFDLLSDKVASVHLKDLRCDHKHMFLKWDEVTIGTGVLDYNTYLKRLNELPKDLPCYCEHLKSEADFAVNFASLHYLAKKAGVKFNSRIE